MSYYAMQNSVPRLIAIFGIAAATLNLGGCASFDPVINTDNCTEQSNGFIGIPLMMEIGGRGSATLKKSCQSGYHLGVSALFGQNKKDGSLAPASIIIFHKKYFEELLGAIQNKINTTPPDDLETDPELKKLSEIKKFADYFLEEQSGKRLNAAMLKTMYDMNITQPDLINPDGTLKPVEDNSTPAQAPQQERFICIGNDVLRKCTPR